MNPQETNSTNVQNTLTPEKFQHLKGFFVIDAPCILSNKKNVYAEDIYDLVDFFDNGELYVRTVKFFDAYLRGYVVTIVLLDLKSGEFIKRKHRLNNDSLPCDWVLMPANNPKPKDNNDELLEFEF